MPTASDQSVEYAGFLRRGFAFLVDMAIAGMLNTLLIIVVFSPEALGRIHQGTTIAELDWRIVMIEQLLPALFTILFWLTWMATPGKLLFGCQVVDARSLQKITPGQAILRYLAYIISTLPLGLGFLWILWDRRKQGWHDKLAKTVVIMEDYARIDLEHAA